MTEFVVYLNLKQSIVVNCDLIFKRQLLQELYNILITKLTVLAHISKQNHLKSY